MTCSIASVLHAAAFFLNSGGVVIMVGGSVAASSAENRNFKTKPNFIVRVCYNCKHV
jgi:hypothetical protein